MNARQAKARCFERETLRQAVAAGRRALESVKDGTAQEADLAAALAVLRAAERFTA